MRCVLLCDSLVILNTTYFCPASVEVECFSSHSTQPSQYHHSPFPVNSVHSRLCSCRAHQGPPNAFSWAGMPVFWTPCIFVAIESVFIKGDESMDMYCLPSQTKGAESITVVDQRPKPRTHWLCLLCKQDCPSPAQGLCNPNPTVS